MNRGYVYYKMKQYDSAISDFDSALKINPEYARAYFNRGLVYADLKQYRQAGESFSQAICYNPLTHVSLMARKDFREIMNNFVATKCE